MTSLVGETFGKYEVNRLLGKGGMGEVYEAFDTDKGRAVALKVLPEEYADDDTFRERFLRESRAAAILQEPHVIPIHDWGEIDHTLYIDMRLVNGQTLHEILQRQVLTPERAIDIIRQVAAALDAAHAKGLIHRDVKPHNIIVTPDDFAYLVDFGIAEARGETHLTMTGYQVGSFAYMAPERLSGNQDATSAVDIYALACVLYEALTGRPPFGGSHQQVIAAHLSSSPPRPSMARSAIPAALDDVIARGMAKHPDDRYGSAGALARAAKRALAAGESASATEETVFAPHNPPPPGGHRPYNGQYQPPPTVPAPPYQDNSRKYLVPTLVAIAAALVVVVIVLLVGVVAKPNPRDASPAVAYPTSGRPTYQPTYETAAEPTHQATTTAPPSSPSSRTVAAPTTASSAQDAAQQLQQYVNLDHYVVATEAAGRWVPQLSSKRPGTVEGGVVWDNSMALQEHLRLRNQYNAKLLWSGDWSTFSESNYWVTIAGTTFADAKGALSWCRSNGFDRDHCIAKLISKTHPVAGSTAYN
ncbi:serine/threonine-protein kinase [Mycobacterium asiaticum]|uniref:non-specific serine/threonine protein kinase n=1 Tax=Mycobacterium asiaticum TaxID=1790 RepID=A0A1A3NDH5_MYCAS|nr:serine/threonine-protein kinase [Mycobacterium asiaticum]OBK19345.1 serine/threonine protein kinase [Mycobacterium asiaticum]